MIGSHFVSKDLSFSLIIPAFNEVKVIAATIDEASVYLESKGWNYEIIVVADGNDGTRELCHRLAESNARLRVLGSSQRRGKGCGVREAMAVSSGDIVGFTDADNKTPISELEKVLEGFNSGADIVIGSRGMGTSVIERKQPFYRRIGSRIFRWGLYVVVGLTDIPDTQCGFKYFTRDVGKTLFAKQVIDGYMFDVEILHLARRARYKVVQIPVRWRDDGDSRLELFSGNIRNLIDILKIRFNIRAIGNHWLRWHWREEGSSARLR